MRRRVRIVLVISGVLVGPLVAGIGAPPADAYCGPDPALVASSSRSNGCSNGCQESAALYERVTRRQAPWLCPQ